MNYKEAKYLVKQYEKAVKTENENEIENLGKVIGSLVVMLSATLSGDMGWALNQMRKTIEENK